MRFAILAAVAVLGMSAPVGAATWIYEVSGDFAYELQEQLIVGDPIPQITTTTGVQSAKYRVQIDTDLPGGRSYIAYTQAPLGDKEGTGNPGLNGFFTTWRFADGIAYFDSATFYADTFRTQFCASNIYAIGCYNYYLTGSASEVVINNFVTSYGGPGPIPEPTTWAMMIGGFGMVGASMRYRRSKMTVAFA